MYPDKKTLIRIAIKEIRKEPKAQGRKETIRNLSNQTGITWSDAEAIVSDAEQNHLRAANLAMAPVFLLIGLLVFVAGFYLTSTNLRVMLEMELVRPSMWRNIADFMNMINPVSAYFTNDGTNMITFFVGVGLLLVGVVVLFKGIGKLMK
jgi:hypothetical protein